MLSKKQLAELYLSGKSMAEIASDFKCSPNKIVYWMNKYQIKRRSRSEATYLKANPNGDPFQIKNNLTSQEKILYGLGLGLYWGEGEKVSKYAVRVANTDPYVILSFSEFLQKICGVGKEKMSYSIVCFQDSDIETVLSYWCKLLDLTREKFGTIVKIPKQGKGTYKRKSLYGVCTLTVSNVKLKTWIINQIDKLKQHAQIV